MKFRVPEQRSSHLTVAHGCKERLGILTEFRQLILSLLFQVEILCSRNSCSRSLVITQSHFSPLHLLKIFSLSFQRVTSECF